MVLTRPNISFAISVASQFLDSPQVSHWDAIIHVLRYLKCAPGQGLCQDHGHTQIVGFIDVYCTGSPSGQKSTIGYCILKLIVILYVRNFCRIYNSNKKCKVN